MALLMDGVCTMEYDDKYLDTSGVQKPHSSFLIKIPCPGEDCPSRVRTYPACGKCRNLCEYAQEYIYCKCGRCNYRYWKFRCSSPSSGSSLRNYDDQTFLDLLERLKPMEELNILILGRTGVGKSTWINAFVNYLQFPTLDDALQHDTLVYKTPFAFRISTSDNEGGSVRTKVDFGFSEANDVTNQDGSVQESDGSDGKSATRKTIVHRLVLVAANLLVRLIDTPGIGDTSGPNQDKDNMAHLLGVLGNYSELHGVLILLAPNEQRLDVAFSFCLQELLTLLHRNATTNIAFGFTNARITDYKPGDTIGPLTQLLKNKKVNIRLKENNSYCFDSEGFRFLAAEKKGCSLGNKNRFSQSWEYSADEAYRLFDYFNRLTPHSLSDTLNLFATRLRIESMSRTMVDLQDQIDGTLKFTDDQIRQLSDKKLKRRELDKFLKIQVKTFSARETDYPRTTCTHKDCIELQKTGQCKADGKPIFTTIYKRDCHAHCFLSGVEQHKIGDPGLKGCYAMNGCDECKECSHSWMVHMHVRYALDETTEEKDDPSVLKQLEQNATDQDLQQAIVASKHTLINELRNELKKIEYAIVQFSIFLKKNAILVVNDATLDYLEFHLREEKNKVDNEGSREKLDRLIAYHKWYKNQLSIHQELDGRYNALSRERVNELVKELKLLKHYGMTLKMLSELDGKTRTDGDQYVSVDSVF